MERVRRLFSPQAAYEPIEDHVEADVDDRQSQPSEQHKAVSRFSRFEYGVFLLLGISMLWAWNMFLAAAPYFYRRFQSNDWAVTHYQPSILSVSTVTNLGSGFVLAKLQKNASYPRRITLSLLINIVVFSLLAFSTILAKNVSVGAYFVFLMLMVFGASFATGMNQNGVFAYVSGFGREEYTQAIMAGQGVAGVLPCIVQILSVLTVPDEKSGEPKGSDSPQESSTSAFAYFITATAVSGSALVAFWVLDKRPSGIASKAPEVDDPTDPGHMHQKSVGLWTLFKKLRWMAMAVFICLAVTMVFPVYTAEIVSVNEAPGASRIFREAVFIPLAFLFWNLGDLIGRISVLIPQISLVHHPVALFVLSVARAGFIPLYLLCNFRGRGAVVESDLFYLFVVQLLFGITNGYLCSSCMMGAGQWVSVDEREPTGSFMSLVLVGGLAAGSLLSFLIGGT